MDYRFSERRRAPPAEPVETPANAEIEKSPQLTGAESEVLWCLFKHGPTWDGNIPSKTGRTDLVSKGLVAQAEGWNWLTTEGVTLALARGLHLRKGF